jgi:molecular chaperone GrpE
MEEQEEPVQNEVTSEDEIDESEAESDEQETTAEEELEELDPLTVAQNEAEDYKDRWLRLAAEFENYKKRTAREFSALVKSASENVISDLLPTLDAVQRALDHKVEEGQSDSESYQEGVRMILEQFPKTLENRGLVEIETVGKPFDPNIHEALMQVESDEHEEGVVTDVVERGYLLGEKVVRHAKVVVSRGLKKEAKGQEVSADGE